MVFKRLIWKPATEDVLSLLKIISDIRFTKSKYKLRNIV